MAEIQKEKQIYRKSDRDTEKKTKIHTMTERLRERNILNRPIFRSNKVHIIGTHTT